MAKDLPYFKFFCSEWNDGDITLEDYKIQGLFINVCSYYWSNECNLTFKTLKKKFKNHIEEIDYLLEEGIIKECVGDNIAINFLDEQQTERKGTSKQNSIAGLKSAEKRRLKKLEEESNEKATPVEITLNGKSTIKRREEEKREENIREEFLKSDAWLNNIAKINNSTPKAIKTFSIEFMIENYSGDFNNTLNDIRKHFANWVKLKLSKGIKTEGSPTRMGLFNIKK